MKLATKSTLLTAALIIFPLSNILLLISVHFTATPDRSYHIQDPAEHGTKSVSAVDDPHRPFADLRAAGGGGALALANSPPDPQSYPNWERLTTVVKEHKLYGTYEQFFASDSQTFLVKKYARVCIVSDEFLARALRTPAPGKGPVHNTGLGTVMTTLAEVLAKNGFDVTLLYTRGQLSEAADVDFWATFFASKKIRFVPLPDTSIAYDVPEPVALSHRVWSWLQQQMWFDIVHFALSKGRGHFTMTAKKQGIAFPDTKFVVHAQMPHLWNKMGALRTMDDVDDLFVDHLERSSVALADAVVSPSRYMLRWMHDGGWAAVLNKTFVHPNLLPAWVGTAQESEVAAVVIFELVFVGRLELRKGLALFCDTLDQLARTPKVLQSVTVTFLGRIADGERILMRGGKTIRPDDYIKERAKKWTFPWQILKDMDVQGRLRYLGEPNSGRLAVLPSLLENSPYLVTECLMAGLPLVATDVGGTAELIHPSDGTRVLAQPNPKSLAALLRPILQEGLVPARPLVTPEVEKTWVVWHHMLLNEIKAEPSKSLQQSSIVTGTPLVTVCMVTYNNPGLLKQALQSLLDQEYKNIEVVIVDDGSPLPEAQRYLAQLDQELKEAVAFKLKGRLVGRIARQDQRGPGAGRNLASTLVNPATEFIMFMDDDNIAKPHEISTFVKVAQRTGADVVTVCNDYFFGDDPPPKGHVPHGRWVPLGAAPNVGMFTNVYGDTNSLIRLKVFRAMGGFPEDYGYAMEDWELFAKTVLSGYKLESVPDPLYWYRVRATSHSHVTATTANAARTIRPYLRSIPRSLHHLVLFAQGMKEATDRWKAELSKKTAAVEEQTGLLRAVGSAVGGVCRDGRLPQHAKNLLANAQFSFAEDGKPTQARYWSPFGKGYVLEASAGRISGHSEEGWGVRLSNDAQDAQRGLIQFVLLDQAAADAVIVSGWSKADQVSGSPDGGYALYVDITYKDGSNTWGYTVPFDTGTHGWQYKAGVIDEGKPIKSLTVHAMFRWHTGTAVFDDLGVSLLKDGLCDYMQFVSSSLAGEGEEEGGMHHGGAVG